MSISDRSFCGLLVRCCRRQRSLVLSARLHAETLGLCCAAEKSSIYSYPGAILPVLTPLMKALAHLFPDKGITQVGARLLLS